MSPAAEGENGFGDFGSFLNDASDFFNDVGSFLGDVGSFLGDVGSFLGDIAGGILAFLGLPVVLDLDGDGVEITPVNQSNQFFDLAGDGYQHHTAWAGAGDGVLAIDADGDGKITQRNEVVFTDWDPTAASDMDALQHVFDTNHNGKLDSGDAQYGAFRVVVTNADGTTSVQTLAQAGISTIDLRSDKTRQAFADGSSIDGTSTFTRTNGTTGTAATVSLAAEADGHIVKSTTTRNGDGSTTIDNKALDPDGSVASEIVSTTSANGLSKTTRFDDDGDGVVDHVQTDVTVNNADGSRTQTLSETTLAGILLNRTTTTTSADRKTVTILRDPDGNGATDERESQVTNADGSKVTTITALTQTGKTVTTTVHSVSADGQTSTTTVDLDGNGTSDLIHQDRTATNGDGSRTQTNTTLNANGSARDRTVTTTSADGATQTVQVDENADGTNDLTRTSSIVRNADGSTITTQTDRNADGSLRGSSVTQISGNGLNTTTKVDADGNGTVDRTHTDVTVINADGSRTETISDLNVQGVLLDKTVIVKGADGVTRTTSIDTDGNGQNDTVDQVTVASGAVTETISNYLPNGTTLKSRTVVSTSADGLTKTIQRDVNGDGNVDSASTVLTVKNADGSVTVTTSERARNNALIGQSVVTTSGDGLTTKTKKDVNGDGTFELNTVAATVVNGDGSSITTATTTSANGTLQSKVVTAVSADHNITTITSDTNGDGATDTIETFMKKASSGSVNHFMELYSPNGAQVSYHRVRTFADGLMTTDESNFDDDYTSGHSDVDRTDLNADGSRTETVTHGSNSNPGILNQTATTTSGNGLSTTVQSDVDGNGTYDLNTTTVTVLNADGGRTTTAKQIAAGVTLNSVATTVSATGLATTVVSDLDGNGAVDRTTTDITTLNADGTTTRTQTDKGGNGAVIDQTTVTTSADGNTVSTIRNLDGTGPAEAQQTVIHKSDGTTLTQDNFYNAGGGLTQAASTSVSADGLSTVYVLDANADGIVDENLSTSTTINADGSTTRTVADTNTSANRSAHGKNSYGDVTRVVTQTSADGLRKTITATGNNETVDIGHTTYDNTVIGADGGTTRTSTVYNANGTLRSKSVTIDAAHGTSHSVQLDEYGTGTYNITDITVLNQDGSKTQTYTEQNQNGTLARKDVTTASASGRNVSQQSDTNGDGSFDRFSTTSLNADGSRSDAIWTTSAAGVLLAKTVKTTSADGRSETTTFDYDGDGATDATMTQISVINSDGSTTQTRSDLNANGTLRDRIITTTSANGYTITGTTDLNGDGTVDETYTNRVVPNTDGSKTQTIQTSYADGSLKNRTVITTSANGLTVTKQEDTNGDGRTDVLKVDRVTSEGGQASAVTYYNANGGVVSSDTLGVSADGRRKLILRDFNGDSVMDAAGYETHAADGNGSYTVAARDARTATFDGNHTIDENGVDKVVLSPDGKSLVFRTKTTDQISRDYDAMDRLYDVVLDRGVTAAEKQEFFRYSDNNSLANSLMNGYEFNHKYGSFGGGDYIGTLSNAQFVERMYENAYGRAPKLSELNNWLGRLKAGTATVADLTISLADSAEHLAVGNTHAFTNNSQGTSGDFTLDHTTDKLAAANIVDGLYLVGLGRNADTTGSTTNTNAILNGSMTEAQIANGLITSREFQLHYGTLNDSQFVSQMFQNGLNRAPTASEQSSWTQMLGAGTISRADLVVGIADSPDHFSATGTRSNSSAMSAAPSNASAAKSSDQSSSMTTNSRAMQADSLGAPDASQGDTEQYASINRLVQSMALMAAPSGFALSPEVAGAQYSQSVLAAAHH